MKLKILFIDLIIFFGALQSFAQYRIGVQAGAGVSNYVGKDFSDDNEPKFGMTAGFFYEREINLSLCLGTEINYEQKGTFYNEYPHTGIAIAVDSRMTYLTIPVFTKVYFGKKADFYLYAGVSASYQLSLTDSVSATGNGFEIGSEQYFPYTYKKWDATLTGGLGFNIKKFSIDIRYHHGLINIYEGNNVPVIRNSFITASIARTLFQKYSLNCFNNRAY